MAKKKTKRRKRRRSNTLPDTPAAKLKGGERKRSSKDEAEVETSEPEASHSLPPTKKSNLPPELAHDDREIDARSIARATGLVLALTLAAMVLMWLVNGALEGAERAEHAAPAPMATSLPSAPTDPRLQRIPSKGLAALRAEEAEQLETYGWVDRDNEVVRVPIERAMELLVDRGLPTRRAPYPPDEEVTEPTDSSLGARGDLR